MRITMIAIAAASITLAACVNPYTKFYSGKPNGQGINNYVPVTEPLQVSRSNDLKSDVEALEKRGYARSANPRSTPTRERSMMTSCATRLKGRRCGRTGFEPLHRHRDRRSAFGATQ